MKWWLRSPPCLARPGSGPRRALDGDPVAGILFRARPGSAADPGNSPFAGHVVRQHRPRDAPHRSAGRERHRRRARQHLPSRAVPEHGPQEIRSLITAFNQMVIRLAEQQTALRQYAHKALLSQEEERQRLSHELHDGTLQDLVGLAQRVELCRNELERDPQAARAAPGGTAAAAGTNAGRRAPHQQRLAPARAGRFGVIDCTGRPVQGPAAGKARPALRVHRQRPGPAPEPRPGAGRLPRGRRRRWPTSASTLKTPPACRSNWPSARRKCVPQ